MRIPSNILSGVPLVWILLFAAYLSMFGESMIVKGAHMFSRAVFGWFGVWNLSIVWRALMETMICAEEPHGTEGSHEIHPLCRELHGKNCVGEGAV